MKHKEYKYLSFDCYGTLIDWESGILNFFSELKELKHIDIDNIEILKSYATFESEEEHKSFQPYREILRKVYLRFGEIYSFDIALHEEYDLADSVKAWPPFLDSSFALHKLKEKYKLIIISNIDDDLFTHSQDLLGIKFDYIFTAFQLKSYKPSLHNFKHVQQTLNLNAENWLHVAQSLYHDHKPISQLGIDSVWIKRQSILGSQGLAPLTDFTPKFSFTSMDDFSKNILNE